MYVCLIICMYVFMYTSPVTKILYFSLYVWADMLVHKRENTYFFNKSPWFVDAHAYACDVAFQYDLPQKNVTSKKTWNCGVWMALKLPEPFRPKGWAKITHTYIQQTQAVLVPFRKFRGKMSMMVDLNGVCVCVCVWNLWNWQWEDWKAEKFWFCV